MESCRGKVNLFFYLQVRGKKGTMEEKIGEEQARRQYGGGGVLVYKEQLRCR